MTGTPAFLRFEPNPPDAAGVISWVHLGDLHMTVAGEQNHRDLVALVKEVNTAFAHAVSFVYLPGDVADHGSAAEYAVVRQALDSLRVPWCSIIGDHDVHEKSFRNFLHFMATETRYAFSISAVRFLALNAFDLPDPGSFTLLSEQLLWVARELRTLPPSDLAVLLLHCYPSDLKRGGDRLRELIQNPSVRLLDMGHTHYNELANDGGTLYTSTRSTGQIEEGPVGYSVTNIDSAVISWKFVRLGKLPVVMITSPSDERFITDTRLANHIVSGPLRVRAKSWGREAILSAVAHFGEKAIELKPIARSQLWEGAFLATEVPNGVHPLRVTVEDAAGDSASDEIRVVIGQSAYRSGPRSERDQDNAVAAWPERGLLGTQLGPNKNGKKW